MVATLIKLKWRMLLNQIKKSIWSVVIAVFIVIYLIQILIGAGIGIGAAGLFLDTGMLTFTLTVIGSLLVAGWAVNPIFSSAMDNSLDPQNFTIFTARTRAFSFGLIVASGTGPGGFFTFVIALLFALSWILHGAILGFIMAICGAVIGSLTAVVAGKLVSGYFSGLATSSQSKDRRMIFNLLIFFGGISMIYYFFFGSSLKISDFIGRLELTAIFFEKVTLFLGFSPLGAAWVFPGYFAQHQWLLGLVSLLLSLGYLFVLLWMWERLLPNFMVISTRVAKARNGKVGIFSQKVKNEGRVDKPKWKFFDFLTDVGVDPVVAAQVIRLLRYCRRDPRFISLLISPIFVCAIFGILGRSIPTLSYLGAPFAGFTLGAMALSGLSLDSSAIWLQITSGVSGWQDRLARLWVVLVVGIPIIVTGILLSSLVFVFRPQSMISQAAWGFGLFFIAAGVYFWVSGRFVFYVQAPNESPLKSNVGVGGQGKTMLLSMVFILVVLALSAPLAVLSVGAIWIPWLNWVTLAVAFIWGLLVLSVGVRKGAKLYDLHQAEILATIRSWPGHSRV